MDGQIWSRFSINGCAMKRIGLFIVCLAGLIFVLPFSPAQDGKKDPEKTEKKDDAKDPEKKDEEKKKADAPPKKMTEKMPPYGNVIRGAKILSANGATNREITIEIQEIDPKKVQDLTNWKAQQAQSLAQQQFNMQRIPPKDVQGQRNAMLNYQKALANYNMELAKRSGNIYSPKPLDVRAHDDAKVRTSFLPVLFDDEGNRKKWTEKEKKEFRGDTQIPGYPSDFDAIKSGQYVDVYFHKKPPPPKGDKAEPKKKKGPDDEPEVKMTPEFIVIVIVSEGK
jgi:hypothetical protein